MKEEKPLSEKINIISPFKYGCYDYEDVAEHVKKLKEEMSVRKPIKPIEIIDKIMGSFNHGPQKKTKDVISAKSDAFSLGTSQRSEDTHAQEKEVGK